MQLCVRPVKPDRARRAPLLRMTESWFKQE